METRQDTFPIFETNQILSNSHLNQLFNYLDEQERLTRANLIGIGIVCGLEIRLDAATSTLHLSKGCGVTSEGYLIVEPQDVALTSYRTYTLPSELDYPPFKDTAAEGLWELFPAGEPGTTALASPASFLDDKAVLLYLELKKDDLRTCSPNSCDDKGAAVTASLRRLLIRTDDLKRIIAGANTLATDLTFADLESAILARLNLPDLRLPRFDVPNTGPVTSEAVLAAFHAVFRADKLAANMGAALSAAYDAFKPLVQETYPTDPFDDFAIDYGFLDDAPTDPAQVQFLQYLYDFFGDLLNAYDEFRWQGLDLLCACCPSGDLFPQHLMLGVLFPSTVDHPDVFRQHFLPSPAISDCEKRTAEVVLLFRRLVDMIEHFTLTPRLAPPSKSLDDDAQIRITPSKLADVSLSDKAIPYYYDQDGDPPLYQRWNVEKSRRNRANQNLSYHADEYAPAAPAFVLEPLRYDLEPYNFLRVEGHLGKAYRGVMKALLAQKTRHRLPIDIIALRTGAFDEDAPVDLSRETGHFPDLETLYDTLREDLLCTLCEGARYLYDIAIEMPDNTPADFTLPGGVPHLPLLTNHAPNYRHKQDTVGAWFEQHLALFESRPYIDIDQDQIDDNLVIGVYCVLFTGTVLPESEFFAHIVSIYYFSKLAEILPDSLDDLGYEDFENKYQDLMGLVRYFRSNAVEDIAAELAAFIPQEDLIDHFDQVLFACKFDPIRAAHEEYVNRIREVKQKQYLSFFLQNHPGIQHNAGVPLGGTFIIVYHEAPAPVQTELRAEFEGRILDEVTSIDLDINRGKVQNVLSRISANQTFIGDADIRYLYGWLTGKIPDPNIAVPTPAGDVASEIIDATVAELADGTVIADFFLPYLCCSEGSAVQYVLPAPPLGLTVELTCTSADGTAAATLTPQGGMPPITYQLDNRPFQPLTGTLLLTAGTHTIVIRDSAGTESVPQTFTVPEPLTIGAESYNDDVEEGTYTLSFALTGGTPPYTADSGAIVDVRYTSPAVKSGDTIRVTITDDAGCTVSQDFTHAVTVPLGLVVTLDCTDPNGAAEATLTPQGGIPPIDYQLDSQPFRRLTSTLSLTVGTHTIIIRDRAGTESTAQSISVPEPLSIGEETYIDNVEAGTYTVRLAISGGTAPYAATPGTVKGRTYTSPPVSSGGAISVTITDSAGCTATQTYQHSVDRACDLPCEGQSRRCAYRLWLQRPSGKAQYSSYRRDGSVTLRFNGEDIAIPNANDLLRIPSALLNNNFDNAISDGVAKLNDAINQALIDEFGEEGNGRLVITYEPEDDAPFDLLWIECFVCETFSIEFDFGFAKPEMSYRLTALYTIEPDDSGAEFNGAIFTNRDSNGQQKRVPAFDCSERNQCDNTDYTPLCKGSKPESSVTIEADSVDVFRLIGKLESSSETEIIAWVWDLSDAWPAEPFYVGQEVLAQVVNSPAPVRLTAITEDGCFGVAFGDLVQ